MGAWSMVLAVSGFVMLYRKCHWEAISSHGLKVEEHQKSVAESLLPGKCRYVNTGGIIMDREGEGIGSYWADQGKGEKWGPGQRRWTSAINAHAKSNLPQFGLHHLPTLLCLTPDIELPIRHLGLTPGQGRNNPFPWIPPDVLSHHRIQCKPPWCSFIGASGGGLGLEHPCDKTAQEEHWGKWSTAPFGSLRLSRPFYSGENIFNSWLKLPKKCSNNIERSLHEVVNLNEKLMPYLLESNHLHNMLEDKRWAILSGSQGFGVEVACDIVIIDSHDKVLNTETMKTQKQY